MVQEVAVVAIIIAAGSSVVMITKAIAGAVLRYQENELKARRGSALTDGVDDARLQRIERALEAIAIEVERISEGQRFTTKLLSERTGAAPAPPNAFPGSAKRRVAEND